MSSQATDSQDHVYVFDGFIVDPYRRSLVREEEEINLGSRALDLLVALLEQAGEILEREHLTARVWPSTIVEESSLRVHVATLRRVLGDGKDGRRYIATVPGRGYGFIGQVTRRQRTLAAPASSSESFATAQALPPSGRLLGRERELAALARLLDNGRLATLTGPGGVGKSAVAAQLAAKTALDGAVCWAADLSNATDAAGVMSQLIHALGGDANNLSPEAAWPWLASSLQRDPGLLVLDNCEHVIDVAAHVVDLLLAEAPQLRVLATSREPLNIEGEHVYRLGGLMLPPARPGCIEDALEGPAVRLLVERARASGNDVAFEDEDADALHELARKLDGLPLALELAAARIRALGLKGVLDHLDDLPELLTRGRRTALPRHRSLNASMAWSCELLDEAERQMLRALSVFPGSFSLTSAAALATHHTASAAAEGLVLRLVEKSLLLAIPEEATSGPACDGTCYRLMHTTRRHAAQLLRSSAANEMEQVNALHARDLLRRLKLSSAVAPAPDADELLQALRWCCASRDAARLALGAQLLEAGLPTIRACGRHDEFQPTVERLLEHMPPKNLDLSALRPLTVEEAR